MSIVDNIGNVAVWVICLGVVVPMALIVWFTCLYLAWFAIKHIPDMVDTFLGRPGEDCDCRDCKPTPKPTPPPPPPPRKWSSP